MQTHAKHLASISCLLQKWETCETFGIEENQSRKRDEHHQLFGSKNKRIYSNTEKILRVFQTHNVNFEASDSVFNILTKKVLPSKEAECFLNAKEIGKARYEQFVEEKIDGNGSTWDTIKREKLSSFVSNNKTLKVTVDNQVVQIREERKLMNRLLVASRTRTDIYLPNFLGTHEFSVVPASLFTSAGSLHHTTDKSVIASELRKLQMGQREEDGANDVNIEGRCVSLTPWQLLTKISIKKRQIQNCSDFASCFINMINHQASDYDEVRVIFDRYETRSLKSITRANRTKGLSAVHYKVSDATKIGHLESKQLLSSINTKNEYLSKQTAHQLEKDYVIVYGKSCLTNLPDLDQELRTNYTHEEADTGIVLHALDVSKRDQCSELVISCSDTDVLLILLHYFDNLASITIFKTAEHEYILRTIHEHLRPNNCKALLGFHAISGCDQTGKFPGFAKKSCWETFMTSPIEVLNALASLGTSNVPSDLEFTSLEAFVVQLYCRNKVPLNVSNLVELHWHMFSKQQLDAKKLPPTREAFCQKVFRAHYTALQWKSSHLPSHHYQIQRTMVGNGTVKIHCMKQ